jgi:hypothetical protein
MMRNSNHSTTSSPRAMGSGASLLQPGSGGSPVVNRATNNSNKSCGTINKKPRLAGDTSPPPLTIAYAQPTSCSSPASEQRNGPPLRLSIASPFVQIMARDKITLEDKQMQRRRVVKEHGAMRNRHIQMTYSGKHQHFRGRQPLFESAFSCLMLLFESCRLTICSLCLHSLLSPRYSFQNGIQPRFISVNSSPKKKS